MGRGGKSRSAAREWRYELQRNDAPLSRASGRGAGRSARGAREGRPIALRADSDEWAGAEERLCAMLPELPREVVACICREQRAAGASVDAVADVLLNLSLSPPPPPHMAESSREEGASSAPPPRTREEPPLCRLPADLTATLLAHLDYQSLGRLGCASCACRELVRAHLRENARANPPPPLRMRATRPRPNAAAALSTYHAAGAHRSGRPPHARLDRRLTTGPPRFHARASRPHPPRSGAQAVQVVSRAVQPAAHARTARAQAHRVHVARCAADKSHIGARR